MRSRVQLQIATYLSFSICAQVNLQILDQLLLSLSLELIGKHKTKHLANYILFFNLQSSIFFRYFCSKIVSLNPQKYIKIIDLIFSKNGNLGELCDFFINVINFWDTVYKLSTRILKTKKSFGINLCQSNCISGYS